MLTVTKYIKPISIYLLFYYITFLGYASLHIHHYHLSNKIVIESENDLHGSHNFHFLDGNSECRLIKFLNTNFSNDSLSFNGISPYITEASNQTVETSSKLNLLEKNNNQLRAPPSKNI